jgi:methylated-DNA-[protein]-cysteine S-methyltransferase
MNKEESMKDEQTYYCRLNTPLGPVLACAQSFAREQALTGLWFEGQKYFPDKRDHWVETVDSPIFVLLDHWLSRYFAGEAPKVDIPLAPRGTTFQQAVWTILRTIPHGTVWSYGDIARKVAAGMGKASMSAQAVGGAVGHNPISIIIPCHRVVGSNGSLTGYSGGIKTKTKLLELEGVDMSKLFVPKRGTAL